MRTPAPLAVLVVDVKDGDSLVVQDGVGHRAELRLQAIDAPERGQRYFLDAGLRLSELAMGRTVVVELIQPDPYGRWVARVRSADGTDINLLMVSEGWAWWSRRYRAELTAVDQQAFAQAEAEARGARRGLWQQARPRPPWEHRRRPRQ